MTVITQKPTDQLQTVKNLDKNKQIKKKKIPPTPNKKKKKKKKKKTRR